MLEGAAIGALSAGLSYAVQSSMPVTMSAEELESPKGSNMALIEADDTLDSGLAPSDITSAQITAEQAFAAQSVLSRQDGDSLTVMLGMVSGKLVYGVRNSSPGWGRGDTYSVLFGAAALGGFIGAAIATDFGAALIASEGGAQVLAEGEVLVGVVTKAGGLTVASRMSSHEQLGNALGLIKDGAFVPGAEPVTIIKEGGELVVLGSHNFGGVLSVPDWAVAAVKAAFK